MSEQAEKKQYRIRNWGAYNEALKQRGSLTFWIDEEVIAGWLKAQKSGKRGASNVYSDLAIATMGTVNAVYDLPGRQTQGFLESILLFMQVDLSGLDHSTLSRRLGKVTIELPYLLCSVRMRVMGW